MEESAEPVVAALALLEVGHRGEVPVEVGPLVSAAHYGGVLGAEGLFSAEAVQRPHQAAAAGRKESEVDLEARKGLLHLERHKGWEQLDAEPACWELGKALSRVLAHIEMMALRMKLREAAGREMHHG
jgi:hypothetical protein